MEKKKIGEKSHQTDGKYKHLLLSYQFSHFSSHLKKKKRQLEERLENKKIQ